MNDEVQTKTVVITGASDGIGKQTAEVFLENGWRVINLSRRASDAQGIVNIKTDVTDEQNVIDSFKEIEERFSSIDVLVNNAGFGISGAVEFTKLDEMKKQFDVNVFGMVLCTREAIRLLRKTQGRVVNISSAASIFAIPFQSFYSATKSAVETLTKAMNNELKQFGIDVVALRLGDVHTSFTSSREKSYEGDDVYGGVIKRSVEVMEHDETNGMSPRTIAEQVYRAATRERAKLLTTVGVKYKAFSLLHKLLPESVVNLVVGKIYMPK